MLSRIIRFFSKQPDTRTQEQPPAETPEKPPEAVPPAVIDALRNMVAAGDTSLAMQYLHENGCNVALIQAQWESALKQYEKGRINFKEFALVQNRIHFSLLEMLNINTQPQFIPASSPTVEITRQDREEIAHLLSEGRLDEVMVRVKNFGRNFVLITARYHSARKHFHLGIISEEEWLEQQERVTEAIQGFMSLSNDF